MKTSRLTGAELNRAVAMALGHDLRYVSDPVGKIGVLGPSYKWVIYEGEEHVHEEKWMLTRAIPDYAGDIRHAWPIMEKMLPRFANGVLGPACQIDINLISSTHQTERSAICLRGDTLIEAAMRCFVYSVYGEAVDL